MLLFSPRKAVLFCQWNYRKAPKLLLFIYNMFLPADHMRWGCVFFTCPSLHAVTRWILQPVTKWHRFDLLFLLQAFFGQGVILTSFSLPFFENLCSGHNHHCRKQWQRSSWGKSVTCESFRISSFASSFKHFWVAWWNPKVLWCCREGEICRPETSSETSLIQICLPTACISDCVWSCPMLGGVGSLGLLSLPLLLSLCLFNPP